MTMKRKKVNWTLFNKPIMDDFNDIPNLKPLE